MQHERLTAWTVSRNTSPLICANQIPIRHSWPSNTRMRTTLSAHPAWKITQSARLSVLTAGDADTHAVLPPLISAQSAAPAAVARLRKDLQAGQGYHAGVSSNWRRRADLEEHISKKKKNQWIQKYQRRSLHVKQFCETMSFKSRQTILYRSHDSGQQPQGCTVCTHHLMFYILSTYVLIFFFSFFSYKHNLSVETI